MIAYTCDRCGSAMKTRDDVWRPEFKKLDTTDQFPVVKQNSIWHVCTQCVESFFRRLPQAAEDSND